MQLTGLRKWVFVGVGTFVVQAFVSGAPEVGAQSSAQSYQRGASTSVQNQGVDSSQYLKAEALVNNGDAAEGRAMVDSLLALAKPGTPQYAEGLYWRAKVSSSAERAQKDYLRVIIEYSESPRVPDALLNLGQMEFVRGERDKALRHFERLRQDYPGHPLQATASYWVARTLLDANDLQRGCAINAEALSQVKPGNVELKNRIEFQNQRCRGVELASKDSGASVAATNSVTEGGNEEEVAVADEAPETPAKSAPATPSTKSVPVKETAKSSTSGARYSVQVAAFKTKSQATAMVESLRKKGYTARVEGKSSPYRVKIGSFTSRAGAEAMLAELKARKIDGFITKG
jgi:cell division septation protein DedD